MRPSITKISPPGLAGTIARPRLFERLDAARSCDVVWLRAPPGSGKTSLVACYAADRALPLVWCRLDADDQDPVQLFHYLAEAAGQADLDGSPLPRLTPAHDPEAFARNFFRGLFAAMPETGTLVLDDYQTLGDDTPVHAVIAAGLAEIPPGRSVLVLSYDPPPPPYARTRVGRRLDVIDRDELLLTEDETRALAVSLNGREPDANTLAALHREAGGWAAGVVLLLDQGKMPVAQSAPPELSQTLFDYFFAEVFARVPADDRALLLDTAELPYLEPATVARMFDCDHAGMRLDDLERRYHFLQRLDDGRGTRIYHAMFRRFLQALNERDRDAAELAALRSRAAGLLDDAGDPEAATALLREAGDWTALSALLHREAPGLLAEGRHTTLAGWLTALPEATRTADPWLRFWYGACRAPFEPRAALADLEAAYRAFDEAGDATGLYCAWAEIADAHAFYGGDLRPLSGWLDELASLQARCPDIPGDDLALRVAASATVALTWHRPDPVRVRPWEERVFAAVHAAPLEGPALMATLQIAIYRSTIGHLDRVAPVLDLVRERVAAPDAPVLARIGADLLEAIVAQYGADRDAWIEAAERGIRRGSQAGIRGLEPSLLSLVIYAHLNAGDLAGARAGLKRFAAIADHSSPVDRAHFHEQQAWFALAEQRPADALEQARLAGTLMRQTGMPFGEAFIHLALAHSHSRLEDQAHAAEAMQRAHELALWMDSPVLRQACAFGQALFAQRQDDGAARRHALEEALRIGARHGLDNSTLMFPWLLEPLLPCAIREGLCPDYTRRIIRKRRFPAPDDTAGDEWPWALEIRSLGGFEVLINGEPLGASGRRGGQPLRLLKALAAFGGRRVSDARLADALWPEAEGDAAQRAFDTTLHRLRRLLGNADLLVLRDHALSLDTGHVRLDTREFESLVERGRALTADAASADAAYALWTRALVLYRGPFLPEETQAAWALSQREHLQDRLRDLACAVADCLERCGRTTDAAKCCRRAADLHPLSETINRRLVEIHERAGEYPQALRAYERYRQRLADTLEVAPSEPMQVAARRLRSAH